jgi:hypothetical protein
VKRCPNCSKRQSLGFVLRTLVFRSSCKDCGKYLRLGGKAPVLIHSILLVFILTVCVVAASRFAEVGSWAFLLLLLLFNALIVAVLRIAFGRLEPIGGEN